MGKVVFGIDHAMHFVALLVHVTFHIVLCAARFFFMKKLSRNDLILNLNVHCTHHVFKKNRITLILNSSKGMVLRMSSSLPSTSRLK